MTVKQGIKEVFKAPDKAGSHHVLPAVLGDSVIGHGHLLDNVIVGGSTRLLTGHSDIELSSKESGASES